MNKREEKIANIFARYLLIILIGLGNFYILYKILTPLTINATNLVLKTFSTTYLIGNLIHLNNVIIEIIQPCVAGSAFYLLIALILSTGEIKSKTRIFAILTASAILFTFNVARIVFLSTIITSPNFETIHWIFWHFVSIIAVVTTYVATIRLYKIKSIPVWTDWRYLKSIFPESSKKNK